jgi:LPS-assembly protein
MRRSAATHLSRTRLPAAQPRHRPHVEDLQDREELRAAGRVAFAKYWSVFGSAVVNLTDREEDPSFSADGFKPLRTRLGLAYADDCLEFGFTWRRDYASLADAERGDTFHVYFSLRHLGFRR